MFHVYTKINIVYKISQHSTNKENTFVV